MHVSKCHLICPLPDVSGNNLDQNAPSPHNVKRVRVLTELKLGSFTPFTSVILPLTRPEIHQGLSNVPADSVACPGMAALASHAIDFGRMKGLITGHADCKFLPENARFLYAASGTTEDPPSKP